LGENKRPTGCLLLPRSLLSHDSLSLTPPINVFSDIPLIFLSGSRPPPASLLLLTRWFGFGVFFEASVFYFERRPFLLCPAPVSLVPFLPPNPFPFFYFFLCAFFPQLLFFFSDHIYNCIADFCVSITYPALVVAPSCPPKKSTYLSTPYTASFNPKQFLTVVPLTTFPDPPPYNPPPKPVPQSFPPPHRVFQQLRETW